MFFRWPQDAQQQIEQRAMAIGGAFLFPKDDAVRELGVKRQRVSADMALVAKEYGISMQLLAIRAHISSIISDAAYKTFVINASKAGWRKHEPSRIEIEKPILFEQLVYRAINEEEISLQKGAELLRDSYEHVAKNCSFNLDDAINL
jgi:Zn-dependent peptidase ImmA (M78 family)